MRQVDDLGDGSSLMVDLLLGNLLLAERAPKPVPIILRLLVRTSSRASDLHSVGLRRMDSCLLSKKASV